MVAVKKFICHECGSDMYIDDIDYNFKGNFDEYHNCPCCQTSVIARYRYNKLWKEDWHTENNGTVRDYFIKHRI